MKYMPPGLVAAPFTPFLPDESVDFSTVPLLAKQLVRNGVVGAFICGTTGEGVSMTSYERRQLAEEWKKALPPELKLIVHVGHQSLAESCVLAQHAESIGADAIASIAPGFFKPVGVDDLVHWTKRVAAAAPKVPFYYYHMPSMTGVRISAAQFLMRASESVPSLAGVKFTDEDIGDFKAAHSFAGEHYDVLFGRDELLLTGLDNGATGAVGSTYNYAAPLYLEIMRAFKTGERVKAEKDQAFACAFIDVMIKHGGLPAGKAIMQLVGLDCGPVRPPLRSLSRTEVAALRDDLDSLGFFPIASTL